MLAPIGGNHTVVAVEIEEDHILRALHDLKWQAAGVVPGDPADNAEALRVDGGCSVVLPRRFSRRRQRQLESRQVFGDVPAWHGIARAFPVSVQIRMPLRGLWRRLAGGKPRNTRQSQRQPQDEFVSHYPRSLLSITIIVRC